MVNEVKSIHYLRGLAPLLVIFHHSIIQFPGLHERYAHFELGQTGVDIFFVISGFVIYLSSIDGRIRPGEFLKRRIIRVVPLYWVATLAVVAAVVCAPGLFASTVVTPQNVGQSLLFIPAYSSAFPGYIWPVLVPGWSLNYEMFFYALFALGLLVAREHLLMFLLTTLGALMVIGLAFDPQFAPLRTYTDLRLLEFLLGVLLASYYLNMGFKGLATLGLLLPAGLLLLTISPALPLPDFGKFPAGAIPATLIVIGSLALEPSMGSKSSAPLQLMGNASYAVYLSHLFTLGALRVAWSKAGIPLNTTGWELAWFGVAMVASVGVGIAVHVWLEQPMLGAGRRLLEGGTLRTPQRMTPRSSGVSAK